jgi:hypothetical protein
MKQVFQTRTLWDCPRTTLARTAKTGNEQKYTGR